MGTSRVFHPFTHRHSKIGWWDSDSASLPHRTPKHTLLVSLGRFPRPAWRKNYSQVLCRHVLRSQVLCRPRPTFIDPRKFRIERFTPRHFIKASLVPTHLNQRHTWWTLMDHSDVTKTILSKRWKYILDRRSHRQQRRATYQETHSERYATFDNTISKIITTRIHLS